MKPLAPPSLRDFEALLPHRNFHELMRRVERLDQRLDPRPASTLREAGRRRPAWLRLSQLAAMTFAATDVGEIRFDADPQEPRASQLHVALRSFGLFAPYGPLPLHMTEHAMFERKFHRNEAFEDFLNMLCAELAWLSYCAASAMSPVLGWERRRHPFRERVRSLAGADESTQALLGTDGHALACRQAHPGLYLARSRPLAPLARLLSDYFATPVKIRPRLRRWLHVGRVAARSAPLLGRWRLGSRVMDAQRGIEVLVGPVSAEAYLAWRRNAPALQALLAIVQDYTGGRLQPLVRLQVRTEPGMAGRIGGGSGMQIGRSSWMHPGTGIAQLTVHDFSDEEPVSS